MRTGPGAALAEFNLGFSEPCRDLATHTRVHLKEDGARYLSSSLDEAPPPLLWRRRQPLQMMRAQPVLLAGRDCRGELGLGG